MVFSIPGFSQDKNGKEAIMVKNEVYNFKIVYAGNSYLKLDTRNGKVTKLKTGWSQTTEKIINSQELASGEDAVKGRFDIIVSEKEATYILLDQFDGRIWSISWSPKDWTFERVPLVE